MKERKVLRNGMKSVIALIALVALPAAPVLAAGLAKNSVRSRHIKDGHVLTQDIGDGAVGTVDLADGAVTTAKIGDSAVTTSKLAGFSVTSSKLAADSVSGGAAGSIADGTITGADIADGAITGGFPAFGAKIAGNTITTNNLADGAVKNTKLGTITTRTNTVTAPAGGAAIVSAQCDPGEVVLGGGAFWDGAATVGPVYLAQLFVGDTVVTAAGRNDGGGNRTLTAQARCLA
jgi:hypothetical protein